MYIEHASATTAGIFPLFNIHAQYHEEKGKQWHNTLFSSGNICDSPYFLLGVSDTSNGSK